MNRSHEPHQSNAQVYVKYSDLYALTCLGLFLLVYMKFK